MLLLLGCVSILNYVGFSLLSRVLGNFCIVNRKNIIAFLSKIILLLSIAYTDRMLISRISGTFVSTGCKNCCNKRNFNKTNNVGITKKLKIKRKKITQNKLAFVLTFSGLCVLNNCFHIAFESVKNGLLRSTRTIKNTRSEWLLNGHVHQYCIALQLYATIIKLQLLCARR